MNKNGKMNPVWILVIGIVALFALGVIKLPQGSTAGTEPLPDGSCELAPTLVNVTLNGVNPGSAVTGTSFPIRVNGVYQGTIIPSSFAYGDSGELIVVAADYIDTKVLFGPLGCGKNTVTVKLYATDDSSIKVFNDVGTVVTDDILGGTTNQSASSTVIDQEIKFIANSDQSSGDLVCVIEATNTAEVSTMVISGVTKVNVPKFYTVAGAGSVAEAYEIPALIDGASKIYNLKITPESGQTIDDTAIYFTCYSKEAFVQPDGTFSYGIEDSDGTAQYEDEFDYDWLIT